MSHFYGTLKGQRGQATRTGTATSGMIATAASWHGAIRTELYRSQDGKDMYRVTQEPWKGAGVFEVLAEGEVGEPSLVQAINLSDFGPYATKEDAQIANELRISVNELRAQRARDDKA